MKTAFRPFLFAGAAVAAAAGPAPDAGLSTPPPADWDSAMLVGSLGRDDPFFEPGEEMVFTIRTEGLKGDVPPDTYFVDWERRGDDGVVEKGRAPLPTADAPLVVRTKSDKPGFVCVEANVVTADGRRVPKNHRWEKRVFFMGGAAVAPETLRPGAEPADYDEFWNAQMAALNAVPVEAELAPTPCADAGVRLYAVRVACAGPRPVTGWLTVPADALPGKRYPLEVAFRGASKDDQPAPSKGPHDRIRFESNGHGFDLGKGSGYVKEFFASVCKPGFEYGFDPESNEHREDSYWLGMALRAVRTLQWAATLPEWDGETFELVAGSQGGWQALLAASRFRRVTKISTSIVWGCDWTGQAEFGRMESTYRPKCWFPDMAYFDAVFAARRVTCPVEISRAGLGDYVSPPSSLAVLYNELHVPKKITWNQGWTHGWSPAGMAAWTVDGGFAAATASPSASAPASHDAGTIVLQNDVLRAEIVPAWAGRLMFFGRAGGPNAFWTDPEAARSAVDAGGPRIWRNVGGEKTWVGSQGAGWRAFAGKEAGIVWPPPAWFDSEPMEVVSADSSNVVLRTAAHRGGDWVVALERSFSLEADALVLRQRLLPESVGARGPEALPDDDRRLWSVVQVPRPDRVLLRFAGEGRSVRNGSIPEPVPSGRPEWVAVDVGGMADDGKLSADGDRLAVPLADGSGWLVVGQTAPARHLSAFANPGRAMVFVSKPDFRPSPYAELEFAAYGPDAEQTLEFRIADDPEL